MRSTSSVTPARTVSGEPMTCVESRSSTNARSSAEYGYAAAVSGVGTGPGVPSRNCRNCSADGSASRRASSSVGAQSTEAAIMA